MAVVDRLSALLPPGTAEQLASNRDRLTEIRLRAGRSAQLCWNGGGLLTEDVVDALALSRLVAALLEFSIYARQDELDRGYFTLEDGSRVGVCGRMFRDGTGPRMGEIGSICVRVARALPGCANVLMDGIDAPSGLRSTLLLSPPGRGKTTLLRDIARQLSGRGYNVAVSDERHELAACHRGIPALDVGTRTDVMDGCLRSEAIGRLLRSMAPEVVVADEIGGEADAAALADAARAGVKVMASAHGDGLDDLLARPCLKAVAEVGVMDRVALLGPSPGQIRAIWRRDGGEGGSTWRRE